MRRQLFSIIGSALCMCLLFLTTFGIYCLSNRNNQEFNLEKTNTINSQLIWNITEQKMRGVSVGLFR